LILKSSQSYSLKILQDHGSAAGGAYSVKSEIHGPADQGHRLIVEWTADL